MGFEGLLRNKKTNAVEKRSAKVSGVVDLTLPDNATLDCTGQYTLSTPDATLAATDTYMNIGARTKTLVWTSGMPRARAPCNDSSRHPLFASQAFQARCDQAFQPRVTVACSAIRNAGGTFSKPFNFGPRMNPAELGTVGLGQMEATIRSTVVVRDVTCATGLFG